MEHLLALLNGLRDTRGDALSSPFLRFSFRCKRSAPGLVLSIEIRDRGHEWHEALVDASTPESMAAGLEVALFELQQKRVGRSSPLAEEGA